MAIKYYSDGTYTKGDGKLYRPGVGVVGNDKSTNVSKAESGTSTSTSNKTTTTSSNKSSSSSNKSSGISSMYQNKPSSSSSSSTSILDKMMENVTSNPVSSSGSSSNVNKTNSGWYTPSSSSSKTEVNPYEDEKYKELQDAYNKQSEEMKANQALYEQKYNELQEMLNATDQKYNDLLNAPNPYEQKYNDIQKAYEEQEEAIREQNRLAVEQGVNRLNAQKNNINQSAEDNARQAYIMHMQAQKALPQQLASQGVTGGATETANLGLATTYQNNVNDINRNKANALQDIDNAIVDLQNTGDLSAVEQVLANNQAALNAYMSNLDKQVGYNQWAAQFNANRADTMAEQAYRDKVYADQMAQQQFENNWYEKNYADNKVQQELENNRYDQSYADKMAQQDRENQWYVDSLEDARKKEEVNRVITLLENGLYNPEQASALLGIPTSQLESFVNDIKRARALELSNTQSLINNRNNSSTESSNATSASLLNNIINTATKMLNEREDVFGDGKVYRNAYGENDVKAYVLSQNITDEEQYKILTNLGLI